jgi:hypothetical protein
VQREAGFTGTWPRYGVIGRLGSGRRALFCSLFLDHWRWQTVLRAGDILFNEMLVEPDQNLGSSAGSGRLPRHLQHCPGPPAASACSDPRCCKSGATRASCAAVGIDLVELFRRPRTISSLPERTLRDTLVESERSHVQFTTRRHLGSGI